MIKYFYCDDNNVYTIKYYDLYHNNCNVNYPTFYNRNLKKKNKRKERWKERRPPSYRCKQSQRSVYLTLFFFLSFYLSIRQSPQYGREICIYMVLLTSCFVIYSLFNKTAQRVRSIRSFYQSAICISCIIVHYGNLSMRYITRYFLNCQFLMPYINNAFSFD